MIDKSVVAEWLVLAVQKVIHDRITHIYRLTHESRRLYFDSPFFGMYAINYFIDVFGSNNTEHSICLETPMTFLNRLRYRNNYNEMVDTAISDYISGIDYMRSVYAYDDAPTKVIVYFLMLCREWIAFHKNITLEKERYFNAIIKKYMYILIQEYMGKFEGDYRGNSDLIELINVDFISVCEFTSIFADEIFK